MLAIIGLTIHSFSQDNAPFTVEIETIEFENIPGLQSFSWGLDEDGRWLILGGRADGLHRRQPFAAFLAQDNNTNIFLIDPETKEIWTVSISTLSTSLQEQLQSTNQEFVQLDSTLYIIGGYGYSATAGDHITYPNLTAVNVNALSRAIRANSSISSHFTQVEDSVFAVTGGHLGHLNDTFYLAGGQKFTGRYNPMGPDHGPGFEQEYTEEVRIFTLKSDLSIDHYNTYRDSELHRRDYNMAPHIFPDGQHGFTMYTGVFKPNVDLPFLNLVHFDHNGYEVNNDFNQYLSQYHSAQTGVYDTINKVMHNYFFGGMSQFTLDSNGNLVEDQDVPFVTTISRVSHYSNDSMVEVKLDIEMPALLGSGAEFIPVISSAYQNEIYMLGEMATEKVLIGYIFGGIESSAPNIFFSNDGSQSEASKRVFAVYLVKQETSNTNRALQTEQILNARIYPNPVVGGAIKVEFNNPALEQVQIEVFNLQGAVVYSNSPEKAHTFRQEADLDLHELAPGQYYLRIRIGHLEGVHKLVIQ